MDDFLSIIKYYVPICSMYEMYTYIWLEYIMVNVGKYSGPKRSVWIVKDHHTFNEFHRIFSMRNWLKKSPATEMSKK